MKWFYSEHESTEQLVRTEKKYQNTTKHTITSKGLEILNNCGHLHILTISLHDHIYQ